MLDACAEIVDELGYEGLTTTLLAERAGVAIGSVYQFFPDKRAVVQALTQRSLETYLQRLTERLAAAELTDWWDGVDAAIEEYIHMHRTVPGFRTLHFGDLTDLQPVEDEPAPGGQEPEVLANNVVIAAQLAEVLAARFAVSDTARLRFALAIAVEAADALIKFAFRRDPNGDEGVFSEAKALIREYLYRSSGLVRKE